jgi:Integrase zinc binding domain
LDLKLKQGLFWMGDRVYVPRSAVDVKLRLLIVAYCGRSGHRPYDETRRKLLQGFVWHNMTEGTQLFLRNCIHCQSTSGPYRIPRPLMQTLHATVPNQLLHFEFLYIGPSISGCTYVLILKDDHTNYAWIRPCKNADGDSAVRAILEWYSVFGIVHDWCSEVSPFCEFTYAIGGSLAPGEASFHHRICALGEQNCRDCVQKCFECATKAVQRIFIGIYAMADGATHCAKSIESDSFYQTGREIPVDCAYYATGGKTRPDLFAEGSCRSDVFRDAPR